MTYFKLACTAVFAAATVLAMPAQAAQWTLDKDNSSLGFTVTTAQAKIEAKFAAYDAQITLDPADLSGAKVSVNIDISSADTGNAQNNGAIASSTWMSVAEFPKATFSSTAIRNTGDNTFEMDGTLSLRGVEKDLTIPFTLDVDGSNAHAKGEVEVIRTDFGIGQGAFASADQVNLEVRVHFDFQASR